MHILSVFILAIACSIDNFAVAIAYGLRKIKIGLISNLLIAIVTGIGTFISLMVGAVIHNYLSASMANLIGSAVITIMGFWIVGDTLEKEKVKIRRKKIMQAKQNQLIPIGAKQTVSHHSSWRDIYDDLSYESFLELPEKADKDKSGYIDAKEALALGFGLAINNLGIGVGGGISGFNIAITTTLSFILSLVAIAWGYALGVRFTTKLSARLTGIISGTLVIGLGVYEYLIS